MVRRSSMLVGLLAGGALLAAACGGDDEAATPAVTATSEAAAAATAAETATATPFTGDPLERPLEGSEAVIAERILRQFPMSEVQRRSISLDELLAGQVRDGIPAIDAPQFVSVGEVDEWLGDEEPVVALEIDGAAKAYPLQILMWHEIVNDELGGVPVTVTFCPLCNTAISFERTVEGEVRDFGTSGMLRRSDLVMYDRQRESLWQQITGDAIVGADVGTTLTFVPSVIVSFGEFRQAHPEGLVLTRDTGFVRDYGTNPYAGYDTIGSSTLFPVEEFGDFRLDAKERVLTVELGGEAVAFPFAALSTQVVIEAEVGGELVVAFWQPGAVSALDGFFIIGSRNVGSAAAYSPFLEGERVEFEARDGAIVDVGSGSRWDVLGNALEGPLAGAALEPVLSANHFWFAWSVFQPETRVVTGESE